MSQPIDLSNLPNDYFGKVAAVGALMVYRATDQFEQELDKALNSGNSEKTGGDPTPGTEQANGQAGQGAEVQGGSGNLGDTGGAEMAQNAKLMALSQRVGFVSSMASSTINKAAEGKSNVAKAG